MTDLLDEGKKLEKKKTDIEKQIETNKRDQEKLQTQIETKKQVYQQFVEKKKN